MTRMYLERIEPAANVRRFYYAFVGPTICGPFCVVRIHGRLGVWQRTLPPLVFADEPSAVKWLDRQRQRKLRRGYREALTADVKRLQPNREKASGGAVPLHDLIQRHSTDQRLDQRGLEDVTICPILEAPR